MGSDLNCGEYCIMGGEDYSDTRVGERKMGVRIVHHIPHGSHNLFSGPKTTKQKCQSDNLTSTWVVERSGSLGNYSQNPPTLDQCYQYYSVLAMESTSCWEAISCSPKRVGHWTYLARWILFMACPNISLIHLFNFRRSYIQDMENVIFLILRPSAHEATQKKLIGHANCQPVSSELLPL
jgi:hypothetical protein